MKPEQVDNLQEFLSEGEKKAGSMEDVEQSIDPSTTKTVTTPEGGEAAREEAPPAQEDATPSAPSAAEGAPQKVTPPTGGQVTLDVALQTIERLSRENESLRQPRRLEAPADAPVVGDVVEVLGYRVPKDRTKRDIKLDNDFLLAHGWNDPKKGPAEVLETVINALAYRAMDVIPRAVMHMIENERKAVEAQAKAEEGLFGQFPDLKDLDPAFLQAVEVRARAEGLGRQYANDPAGYQTALGKRARASVAKLRGLTPEQYEAALSTQQGGGANGAGRGRGSLAATSGKGGAPRQKATGQQAEIDEVLTH